jgi:hypothetical protein
MLAEGKITEKRKAPERNGGSPNARNPERAPNVSVLRLGFGPMAFRV